MSVSCSFYFAMRLRLQLMKRRMVVASCLLCLSIFAAILVVPGGYTLPAGLVNGESFYRGRPTSYWHQELSLQDEELWSPLSCDYYICRSPTTFETWFDRLRGRTVTMRRSALLEGDPAALPVLLELLRYRDCKTRRAVALGLASIGPKAKAAVPTLVEIAQTTPDYALHVCACDALRCIDAAAAPHMKLGRSEQSWRSGARWELLP
jgi:hypothetical protein